MSDSSGTHPEIADSTSAAELLACVEQSPRAVANHDKSAWMAIFATDYRLEDPVGSTPIIGRSDSAVTDPGQQSPLGRFYDTFIAANQINFEVKQDLICGNHVLRDLSLQLSLSGQLSASVPMHLLYELTQQDGEWKIARLAAHWELLPMVKQVLGQGLGSLGVLSALSYRMLLNQGPSGMLSFSKAAFSIGKPGKRRLETLIEAINKRDGALLQQQFEHRVPCIHAPVGTAPISPGQLLDVLTARLETGKIIAAGNMVSASLTIEKAGQAQAAAVIAEFDRRSTKISQLRFYYH